jgi:hypothetical protein
MRLLVTAGILLLLNFLIWLFEPSRRGDLWLFWPLTAALLLKVSRWLIEWMYCLRITPPPFVPPQRHWTVDVFTTACPGEPKEMIVRTLRAMKAIEYPHENYLCDEGDDPYLRQVCAELGAHHVTRSEKRDAKAGNINNALRQSDGEICVILDPDHEPAPYLLHRVLGYFEDQRVGFVQTSQPYGNQSDSLIARGAAEQTYHFYGPTMMGMHACGNVQAIGANCVFRRKALESIGGHAAGLAEDMHTAMRLYAQGWRSVYAPEALTRGLVPSTLGAYWKQQIKWACGSFDLLFTVYPRLFRRFTGWQRLHYFVAPTFYLAGLVGLINIAVPIVCLLFGWVAWRVTLGELLAWYLPVVFFAGLIRQASQFYLVEPHRERGYHFIGGLLAAGSWHVFLRGFLCAVFRIKIPYIPTPKDNEPEDAWRLAAPNFAAAAISVFAVVYGLSRDWTPYSWLMAVFALWNASVLLFVAMLGQQRTLGMLRRCLRIAGGTCRSGGETQSGDRRINPLLRAARAVHSGSLKFWGRWSLTAACLLVSGSVFLQLFLRGSFDDALLDPSVRLLAQEKDLGGFYTGVYLPELDDGALPPRLSGVEAQLGISAGIVSIYQAWGPQEVRPFPGEMLREIQRRGAVPLINWQPWTDLFLQFKNDSDLSRNRRVCAAIVQGRFDAYLKAYAARVRELDGPVLIRFAHEMDNPRYPWSGSGGNTPEEFQGAWRHVVNLFNAEGACNVGWVWSPLGTTSPDAYFPGAGFVDWVGVTALNHAPSAANRSWRGFSDIYEPMRWQVLRYNRPVILTELGTTGNDGDRAQWFTAALGAIAQNYPEIKSVVFFHTDRDGQLNGQHRSPANVQPIDWTFCNSRAVVDAIRTSLSAKRFVDRESTLDALTRARPVGPPPPRPAESALVRAGDGHYDLLVDGKPFYVRGVAFNPAHDWRDGHRPLTRRELEKDLPQVKAMGANTLRRYGVGWYDRNILNLAAEHQLKVLYGFWFEHHVDYVRDEDKLASYERMVERTVVEYRRHPSLLGWTLGNETWGLLKHHYGQPYLTYVRQAHVAFVERLARRIRELDPQHPVFVVHEHSDQLAGALLDFSRGAPSVDVTGVNSYYEPQISELAAVLKRFDRDRPYLVSEFGPDGYWHADFTARGSRGELVEPSAADKARYYQDRWQRHVEAHRGLNVGGVAYCWRDRYEATPTWFGLTDSEGNEKPAYFALRQSWTGQLPPGEGPRIVNVIAQGAQANYAPRGSLSVRSDVRVAPGESPAYSWSLSGENFERELGKVNVVSGGSAANITLPKRPGWYRVHLQVRDSRGLDEFTYPVLVTAPASSSESSSQAHVTERRSPLTSTIGMSVKR